MSILIKQVLLNNQLKDILIEGNTIKNIESNIDVVADKVIEGKGKAAVSGMTNGHTHSAMTLMRGFADDMPLKPWLEEKIWPLEKNITEEDVYWGTKLACLEMIKTGTTLFFDMYHHFPGAIRAVEEMGLRAVLTQAGFDFDQKQLAQNYKKRINEFIKTIDDFSDRIKFGMGPHSIYTVSTNLLKWIKGFADDNGLKIQTHLSETVEEVENSIKNFGYTPVQYLNSIGFLDSNVSLAHCIHLNDTDIKILAEKGCQVVHNPASNMKLASGNRFRYADLKKAGIPISLGTDGTCSGNNLDMFETMKLAALMGKVTWQDATLWKAGDTFKMATDVAEILTGFKTGKIEVGYLADISLVSLNLPEMTPNINLISNLVYSANGNVVDTLICDGKILMENRIVPGEEDIIKKAGNIAFELIGRHK